MRQMTSCTSHVFADMREMNDRNRFKDTSERLERSKISDLSFTLACPENTQSLKSHSSDGLSYFLVKMVQKNH